MRHPSVEHVDHVDLDDEVVKTCERFFPQWGDAWKDPKVKLHIKDGAQFVQDAPDNYYDVIIQDSSDPWIIDDDGNKTPLPSGVLYEKDHICQLHRILQPNGILNIQVSCFIGGLLLLLSRRVAVNWRGRSQKIDLFLWSHSYF